jgi:ubiquinone/menaquinone biosynthesis C-methylase UbiE
VTVGDSAILDATGVRRLYDRVAPFYDLATKPYGWVGADRLVNHAVAELRLRPGDTVVDLGTGTGRNLAALAALVGPTGRVIGVDVSPGMLQRARRKTTKACLGQVELVETDMAGYEPPVDAGAVLSTYAIEMLPDYDEVIARLAMTIRPGGRIAVTGLRDPARWPEWAIRLGSALNRMFGVADAYRSHHPWEAIEAHTSDTIYEEAMAGAVYLAAGTTTEAEGGPQ